MNNYLEDCLLFQIVNEMASAAGLPCDIDPALCAALRTQKSGRFNVFKICVF